MRPNDCAGLVPALRGLWTRRNPVIGVEKEVQPEALGITGQFKVWKPLKGLGFRV